MYSAQVLDHFQNPRNSGDLPDADVTVSVENPVCGDVIRLSLRVSDGRIAECRFKVRGCATAIACGSLLTELIKGKSLEDARKVDRQQIVDALGGLSNETSHGSHLAIDVLHQALKSVS